MTNKYGDVRFMHFADSLRPDPLVGGATVAYRVDGDTVTYASAFCSANDRFTKQYGRSRSFGLLNQFLGTSPEPMPLAQTSPRKGCFKGTVAELADMMGTHCGFYSRSASLMSYHEANAKWPLA